MRSNLYRLCLLLLIGLLSPGEFVAATEDSPEAAREKLVGLLDTAPASAGVLVVYMRGAPVFSTGGAVQRSIQGTAVPPIYYKMTMGASSYMNVYVFHVPPGQYVIPPGPSVMGKFDPDLVPIRFRLQVGELKVLRFAREGHRAKELTRAGLLADPALRDLESTSFVDGVDLGWLARRAAAAGILNGEEIVVRARDGCLVEPVRILWPNASLRAQVTDCRMTRAELQFDDGISVDMALAPAKRLGIRWLAHDGPVMVAEVFDGSPAQAAGILPFTRVFAVDGQRVFPGEASYRHATRLIRAAEGAPVTLSIANPDDPSARRDVTLAPASSRWTRLLFRPVSPMAVTYPDGRRFDGPVGLVAAQEPGQPLPPPQLGDLGQLTHVQGGYLGAFSEGRAHGWGWCFDGRGTGGEACRYERGTRVELGTVVPARSRAAILADAQGLTGRPAIDLLRRKMIDAISAERWPRFLRHHRDLQTLGVDTGLEAIYYEGRALASLNRVAPAFERVQAYLNLAGSSGAAYADALSLYAELEPRAAAARAARERERAQSASERRAFCKARIEMAAPLCGCREFKGLAPAKMECGA